MQQLKSTFKDQPIVSKKSKPIPKGIPLYKPLFCVFPEARLPSGHMFPEGSRVTLHLHSILSTTFQRFLLLTLILFCSGKIFAQDAGNGGEELLQRRPFTGSLSLTTEYRSIDQEESYRSSGGNLFGFASVEHQFSSGRIPVDVAFSTEDNSRGDSYLRFGVHPELLNGRLKLHAGDFYAEASDLTVGNASLFGVGGSLQGGKFRGGVWYGSVERPAFWNDTLQEDTRRTLVGGKVGFGTDEGGFFDVTASHVLDDAGSDEENLMIGGNFFLPIIGQKLTVMGEGVVVAWSSDLAAEEVEADIPFFTPRESSQFDGAASFALYYAPSGGSTIGFSSRWIGPGYVNLAQPYSQNDLFETMLTPSLTFFDGRIYTTGSLGIQWDNLRKTKEGRTTEIVGSLFTTIRPISSVSLSFSYNDFGASSDHANDTVRYGYLSRSLSFAPTLYWNGFGGVQVGSVNASLQKGKTRNVGGDFTESSVCTVDLIWSLTLPSMFSLTSGLGYTATDVADYQTEMFSARETISHVLLSGKLSGTLTFGVSHYQAEGRTAFDLSGGVTYDLGYPGLLSLTFSNSVDNGFGSQTGTNRELYGALRYGLRI